MVINLSETDIQRLILDYLSHRRLLGYFYRTNNIPAVTKVNGEMHFRRLPKYAARGLPDITGVLSNGKACYIEVKAAKGKLSAAQVEFKERVESLGGVYVVARTLEDVVAALG